MITRTGLQWSPGAAGPAVNRDWHAAAACRTADPELFFPPVGASAGRIGQATAICAGCPVAAECLEFAQARYIDEGVWGGLTRSERRSQRAAARPRPVTPVTAARKRCGTCKATKAAAEFHRDRTSQDGLMWRCKMCRSGGTAAAA